MKARSTGSTITEVLVAVVVLSVISTMVAQTIAMLASHRRVVARRTLAIQEAANTLEYVGVSDFDDVNEDEMNKLTLSEHARSSLVGAKIEIDVAEVPGVPRAKRITVQVFWQDGSGAQNASVRLVAWKYARET